MNNSNSIFIPNNVPSLKNSKQWTGNKLISSNLVLQYKKNTASYFLLYYRKWKEMIKDKEFPLVIEFYFIRDSNRRFDYVNCVQLSLDMMVSYEWLPDDSTKYVIPDFHKGYEINKDNPGVIITVQ